MYVDDASKNREWVDHPLCVNFTANIKNRFRTRGIPEDRRVWTVDNVPDAEPLEAPVMRFDDSPQTEEMIQTIIIEAWQKRSNQETLNRNLVMMVASASGIPEVRRFLCLKLENILLNNKLLKASQEALSTVCANVTSSTEQDRVRDRRFALFRLANHTPFGNLSITQSILNG